jgi:hypothetical protein
LPKATTSSRSRRQKPAALADAQVAELDEAISRDAVRGARYDDSGRTTS